MAGASRTATYGAAAAITLAGLCAPASQVAAADDGGVGAFFREVFGGGAAPAAPEPQYYELPQERPIIVRPKRTHSVARRPHVKIAVGPVTPVSIYEDRTLKPGDAVMTKTGVRVFLGGRGTPYTESNFAALSDAEGLPRQVEKALSVIDKAPRG